ncbi:hypothetical protein TELCIR_10314 [Teladorsagia circumcincta]|uniref:Uncharacterized protein n=1 Tax=Teladorsagia circumcincta TaxID=45464 RepID=A0A2G9UCH3_TELCI|nr:hypothetical protein TELCIR_10314 [Teladorsagia circumcincta]
MKHNLLNYIGMVITLIRYIIMTMFLAILHGLMMSPLDILKQRHPSNDPYRVFDYIWSFYSTVFVFSTLYFVLYCVIRREKAYVVRELVLPSVGYASSHYQRFVGRSCVQINYGEFPIITNFIGCVY